MEFEHLYYRGKHLERDTAAKSGIMYVKPVRKHWWQLWRPKQKYLDFRALNRELERIVEDVNR